MDTVNLFFSCDDNYIPFLAVTLTSIRKNCDPNRRYAVRILHTGVKEENKLRLMEQFHSDGFTVEFTDISFMVRAIADQLHTRDYYSKSTYYRLFIPELFPDLSRVLYLDCDIIVQSDVAELYDQGLGNDLVGAVPDSMVTAIVPFSNYVSNRLRVLPKNYFNAGVLLMNLDAMRQCDFSQVFLRLLKNVTFQVAQDQDYLNVICKGRVTYLGHEWNTMPGAARCEDPKLIHFNLDCKPWWRDDVPFGGVFWQYAQNCGFYQELLDIRSGFTPERIERSARQTGNLIALGQRQANRRIRNMYLNWKIKRAVNL